MEEYSYQQKIAMLRILLDIIHADGYIDAREKHFFNEIRELLQLEEEDYAIVKETNSLLALLQIKSFNDEQKMGFALYMSIVISTVMRNKQVLPIIIVLFVSMFSSNMYIGPQFVFYFTYLYLLKLKTENNYGPET